MHFEQKCVRIERVLISRFFHGRRPLDNDECRSYGWYPLEEILFLCCLGVGAVLGILRANALTKRLTNWNFSTVRCEKEIVKFLASSS